MSAGRNHRAMAGKARRLAAVISINGSFLLSAAGIALWWWTYPQADVQGSLSQYVFGSIGALLGFAGAMSGLKTMAQLFRRDRDFAHYFEHGDGRKSAKLVDRKGLLKAGMLGETGGRALGIWPETGELISEPYHVRDNNLGASLVGAAGDWKTQSGPMTWLASTAGDATRGSWTMDGKNGQIFSTCHKILAARGHRVGLLDDSAMLGAHPLKVSMNCLGHIVQAFKAKDPRRFSMVRLACLALIKEPETGDDKNKFWRKEPRRRLAFAIAYLAIHHPKFCTPGGVWSLISDPESFADNLDIAAEALQEGEGWLKALAIAIRDNAEKNPEQEAQHMSEAVDVLDIFAEGSALHEAGFNETLSHKQALEKGWHIFHAGPQAQMDDYAPLYTLHQMAAVATQLARPGQRKRDMVLEEMTSQNLGWLLGKITTVREYGLRYLQIYQSKSEVERRFSKDLAKTLEDNTAVKQWFGFSVEEAERVSKIIGDELLVSPSLNENSDDLKYSGGLNSNWQRLFTPKQLMDFAKAEQLIHVKGVGWIHCLKLGAHQIAPACYDLLPNPFDPSGTLQPDPKITIATIARKEAA